MITLELPSRKKNRLDEYDYSAPNAYFITICTDKRRNLFWKDISSIVNSMEDVALTPYGEIATKVILEIPGHYPMISVDTFAVMPNHVHLLLQINTDHGGRPMAAPTIAMVVNQMKGAVSKQIGFPVWQKGYYDHVIRNNADYREVWQYIEGNPGKWTEDKNNR